MLWGIRLEWNAEWNELATGRFGSAGLSSRSNRPGARAHHHSNGEEYLGEGWMRGRRRLMMWLMKDEEERVSVLK